MSRKYGVNGKIGPARGFTWGEVRCTDGTLPTERYMRRRFRKQARLLNKLRASVAQEYGGKAKVKRVSINVNSWYRSGSYNASIGGAKFSQHVVGRATDVTISVYFHKGRSKRLTPAQVAAAAVRIPAFNHGGIGVYDKDHGNFTHLDHRSDGPARWFNG